MFDNISVLAFLISEVELSVYLLTMRIAHFVIALMLFPGIKKLKAQTRIAFYTNYGNFEVTLNDSLAPITAGNFKKLVEEKFYDGVIFHRVIDGFMIQGGDPTGTGSGGPGYTIEDEFDSRLSNVQKTISMANSGPNTGGSQFFINLVNNTYLDYNKQPFTSKHPVFGIVTDSFEVVQRIGKVQTNGSNRPVNDVVMDSVRVVKEEGEPDYPSNGNFIVLGNPLTSDSRLLVRADSGEILKLQCMNIFGQLIWEQEVQIDRKELVLSLKSLYQAMSGNAVYILRQQIADRVSEIKLVKSELQ